MRAKNVSIVIVSSVCAFFVVTVFPWSFDWGYSYFERQRLAQIFLLSVTAFSFSCYLVLMRVPIRIRRDISSLLLLVIALGFFSALNSAAVAHSLIYTLHICFLVLFSVSLGWMVQPQMLISTLNVFVGCQFALVCYSTLFLCFAIFQGDQLDPRVIYYGFDNIRFFNQVQAFVMPLLLFYFSQSRLAGLATLALFLNLVLMFVGGGLGILLTWLLALGIGFVFKPRLAIKGGALTALAFFVVLVLRTANADGFDALVTMTSGGRVELWSVALAQLDWSNLVVGNGPGTFRGVVSNLTLSHPHNSIIELLVEWGALATVIAIGLVMFLLSMLAEARRYKEDVLQDALVLGLVAGFALSFVSGISVMPVAQTLLCLFAGGACGRVADARAIERGADKAMVEISVPGTKVLGGCLLIICMLYMICTLMSFASFDPMFLAPFGPRFWSDGHFIL